MGKNDKKNAVTKEPAGPATEPPAAATATNDAVKSAADSTKGTAQAGADAVKQGADWMADTVSRGVDTANPGESAAQTTQGFSDTVQRVGTDAMQTMKGASESVGSAAQSTGQSAVETAKAAANNTSRYAQAAPYKASEYAADTTKGAYTAATGSAQAAGQYLTDTTKATYGTAQQAGTVAYDASKAAYDTALKAGDVAYGTAKGAVDYGRDTAQYGYNVAKSAAQTVGGGMQKGATLTADAAGATYQTSKRILDTAIDAMKGTYTLLAGSEGGEQTDFVSRATGPVKETVARVQQQAYDAARPYLEPVIRHPYTQKAREVAAPYVSRASDGVSYVANIPRQTYMKAQDMGKGLVCAANGTVKVAGRALRVVTQRASGVELEPLKQPSEKEERVMVEHARLLAYPGGLSDFQRARKKRQGAVFSRKPDDVTSVILQAAVLMVVSNVALADTLWWRFRQGLGYGLQASSKVLFG